MLFSLPNPFFFSRCPSTFTDLSVISVWCKVQCRDNQGYARGGRRRCTICRMLEQFNPNCPKLQKLRVHVCVYLCSGSYRERERESESERERKERVSKRHAHTDRRERHGDRKMQREKSVHIPHRILHKRIYLMLYECMWPYLNIILTRRSN